MELVTRGCLAGAVLVGDEELRGNTYHLVDVGVDIRRWDVAVLF